MCNFLRLFISSWRSEFPFCIISLQPEELLLGSLAVQVCTIWILSVFFDLKMFLFHLWDKIIFYLDLCLSSELEVFSFSILKVYSAVLSSPCFLMRNQWSFELLFYCMWVWFLLVFCVFSPLFLVFSNSAIMCLSPRPPFFHSACGLLSVLNC